MAAVGCARDFVDSLLFPAPPPRHGPDDFPQELLWIPKSHSSPTASLEDTVPCLLLRSPSSRFFLIYFHSNAEDLGRCYTFCSIMRYQFQVHVLAVEYPGYGLCQGGVAATEESVMENADNAIRFLLEVLRWPLDSILLFGRSIGCGPALQLAADYKVGGLALVAPFCSLRELCRDFVGPVAAFVRDRFRNRDRMKRVQSPVLVVHGKKDAIVPHTHGQALFEECRTRKRFICPNDMHHNSNLMGNAGAFVLPMLQFFSLPDYVYDDPIVPDWAYSRSAASQVRCSGLPRELGVAGWGPYRSSPVILESQNGESAIFPEKPQWVSSETSSDPTADGEGRIARMHRVNEKDAPSICTERSADCSDGYQSDVWQVPTSDTCDENEWLDLPPEEGGFLKVPRSQGSAVGGSGLFGLCPSKVKGPPESSFMCGTARLSAGYLFRL